MMRWLLVECWMAARVGPSSLSSWLWPHSTCLHFKLFALICGLAVWGGEQNATLAVFMYKTVFLIYNKVWIFVTPYTSGFFQALLFFVCFWWGLVVCLHPRVCLFWWCPALDCYGCKKFCAVVLPACKRCVWAVGAVLVVLSCPREDRKVGGRAGSLCCRGAVLSLPAEGAAGAEGLPPGGKQTQNKGPDIPSTGTAKSSLLFTGPICKSRAILFPNSVLNVRTDYCDSRQPSFEIQPVYSCRVGFFYFSQQRKMHARLINLHYT